MPLLFIKNLIQMKKRLYFILIAALLASCNGAEQAPISSNQINQLIENGEYTKATKAIKGKIATDTTLSTIDILNLELQSDILQRIREDFTKTDSTIIAFIKENYPEVTKQEIQNWEKSGALECKVIDGEKKYFYNAHRNLFRISKEAQEKQQKIKGRQSDSLDRFLAKLIPSIEKYNGKNFSNNKFEKLVMPQDFKFSITMVVKPNTVPDGETVRVWLPFPRESAQYKNIKLLSTNKEEYIISPDNYPHKSLYMEGIAQKDSALTFTYTASLTSFNRWFQFNEEDVKPYNKTSDIYREYTKEREAHVIFTPAIKTITDSLINGIENPYLKAKKIFEYISSNYPWASAREYSTIANIPQYVIDNKHGDCGQVSLLYITMARYAGIPSKWQSGWMLHPGEVNLHDWAESYYEGIGWVPVDQSFGISPYYTKGLDAYRLIVNEDFSGQFYPAKIHPRSETVDFQRGEVEWRGGNIYFNGWRTRLRMLP